MTKEHVAQAVAEGPARYKERQAICTFIRDRAASALNLAKRGRFSEAEGVRLARWLNAAADDIDAQMHDDAPAAG